MFKNIKKFTLVEVVIASAITLTTFTIVADVVLQEFQVLTQNLAQLEKIEEQRKDFLEANGIVYESKTISVAIKESDER